MTKKEGGFIFWAPRILSIVFILFLALFSLDVIAPGLSIQEILRGLLMHNIPSLILLVVLILAWKHEIVGGITFVAAGVFYVLLTFFRASIPWYIATSWSITIAGPAFLIGILFLVGWARGRKTV